MKIRIHENIPLFPIGMNRNRMLITHEVANKCIKSFDKKPVLITSDSYNEKDRVVGFIDKITKIDDCFVYGDIIQIFNEEMGVETEIGEFYSYEINAQEFHSEKDATVIDEFSLNNVCFDLK